MQGAREGPTEAYLSGTPQGGIERATQQIAGYEMSFMQLHQNQREEILASLCLLAEGEKGKGLFSFAPPDKEALLNEIAGRIVHEGKVDKKALIERFRRLNRWRNFSSLEEIHPGWILERLEGESPRLFGLLCRFLSAEKVRQIISRLNARSAGFPQGLPKVRESYQVTPGVAEIVRSGIEKRLALCFPLPSGGPFLFEHIALMKTDDLKTLFWDLGLATIRKAFDRVETRILRTFLARFSTTDAAEIRSRIEQGDLVTSEAKEEAQKFLATFPYDSLSSERLFREIGYGVFCRAILPAEIGWVELVIHKLPPEEGYRLKRILREVPHAGPPETVQERKETIVKRLFTLVRQGRIRRYWKE